MDNGVCRVTSKRPQQLMDGEGRNSSTPLLSPAKKKHQTAGEVPDLHAGKLVAISSNGRGHQLCASILLLPPSRNFRNCRDWSQLWHGVEQRIVTGIWVF